MTLTDIDRIITLRFPASKNYSITDAATRTLKTHGIAVSPRCAGIAPLIPLQCQQPSGNLSCSNSIPSEGHIFFWMLKKVRSLLGSGSLT